MQFLDARLASLFALDLAKDHAKHSPASNHYRMVSSVNGFRSDSWLTSYIFVVWLVEHDALNATRHDSVVILQAAVTDPVIPIQPRLKPARQIRQMSKRRRSPLQVARGRTCSSPASSDAQLSEHLCIAFCSWHWHSKPFTGAWWGHCCRRIAPGSWEILECYIAITISRGQSFYHFSVLRTSGTL